MKKSLIRSLTLALILCLTLSTTAFAADMPRFMNVIAGPTGGMYYPVGISIAEILTNKLGIQATAQITGGAAENPSLVQNLDGEVGLTMTSSAYAAYYGKAPYTSACSDVVGWFNNISTGVLHMIVRKDSGINSIADIKGKRVAMGPAGNGGLGISSNIWKLYGFTADECTTTYCSFADGLAALKDGNVDVALVQSTPPAAAVVEFAVTYSNFKILSIDVDVAEKLLAENPYYAMVELAAEVYGTEEGATVIGVPVMAIVSATLSEDVVYELTKAVMENIDTVRGAAAAAKNFAVENAAKDMPIPFHPGAEKYFREIGLIN